jgi:hypothetical protein
MSEKAKFLKRLDVFHGKKFVGPGELYKLSGPIEYGNNQMTSYVVMLIDGFAYILPSDCSGNVLEWSRYERARERDTKIYNDYMDWTKQRTSPTETLKFIGYDTERTAKILKVWDDELTDRNMALYELSEPLEYKDDDENGEPAKTTRYVLVSAIAFYPGPETYVFPCDEEGRVRDHIKIRGSYRGGTSHKQALAGLGYELEVE